MGDAVLICGFGAFGRLHADGWRLAEPGLRLMVSDPDAGARAAALSMGIAQGDVAATPEPLIERAALVDIVAPPAQHMPLARIALAAGKPVLIEKPAVETVAEADELARLAGDLPVQIGHVLRAHPLVARARALLAEGAIGRLLRLEGESAGWKRMRADSGLIANDGVHLLDLMRHCAGGAITGVDLHEVRALSPDIADDLRITLSLAGGISATLRLGILVAGAREDGFMPGALTEKRLTLIGDAGNLALDFNAGTLRHARVNYARQGDVFAVTPGAVVQEMAIGITPATLLARSFAMFRAAMAGRGPVLCNIAEGAREMARVMQALTPTQRPLRPIEGAA
ncbi:Gfo/Idh/MocA family protein [Oceaniglobus trochenteri]|uniref:Gfo/Idh/MocA family protein n=1 Tax=Oceaniglobus trochenteri TaxID=2763260 RepID=UPI001CFFB9EF|nr:Gfo/Idh/MocA family oxidoreductase [Oceaniglobus trochenteri]